MKPHTRWCNRGVSWQAGFASLFVPVRTVENNVLKILNFLTTTDTDVSNLKGRMRTFLVPNATKRSVEGRLAVVLLTLTIELELP
eukprot:839249-Amphidinium_carterae.1